MTIPNLNVEVAGINPISLEITVPQGADGLVFALDKPTLAVLAASDGSSPVLTDAIFNASILRGKNNDTANWTIGTSLVGCTGSLVNHTTYVTFTVATMTSDTATVTFSATREGFATLSVIATLVKVKQLDAAAAVTAHEATYSHGNIPTAAGKTAADGIAAAAGSSLPGRISVLNEGVFKSRKAVLNNSKQGAVFYAPLTEDVLDEKSNSGTFTRAGTRTNPVYGHTVASGVPAIVPRKPGGMCDYQVLTNYFVMAVSSSGLLYGVLEDTAANQKILKSSSDNGLTWSNVYTFGQRIRDVHIVSASGTILVSIADDEVGTDATTAACKIYRSTDGTTFTKVLDVAAGSIVQWGFSDYGAYVLACTYGGRTAGTDARYVYVSSDDGATFSVSKDFGSSWGGHIHRAAFDPYNAGHAYLFTGDVDANCAVYKSKDYGATWVLKFSGSQKYRFVGINFDANYVYFGGDGKHVVDGTNSHFAIYKYNRTTEALTLMTVTYGPTYEIWKDQTGQLFAFGLNDQVDTTDNVARVYWLDSAGSWRVLKEFSTPSTSTSAGFSKVFHYKQYVYAMCNELLVTNDNVATLIFDSKSLNKTMIRVEGAATAGYTEKIAWNLPAALPQSFTLFMVIHFPSTSILTATNYILMLLKDAANAFVVTCGTTRVFTFGKRKTGETTATISSTSGDVADGDTVVLCVRQDSANYISCILRLASGKYRRSAKVATTFAHDAAITAMQTGYTSAGYEPNVDISNILLCYRYCDDGEAQQIMEELIS